MINYSIKFVGVFETRMGRDVSEPINCSINVEGVPPRKDESPKFNKTDLEVIAKAHDSSLRQDVDLTTLRVTDSYHSVKQNDLGNGIFNSKYQVDVSPSK